ncbi:MAG: FAD-dependent oxidoreductase [Deltaproteobacteria bacterium]|nr:FAD-dependent oxidoreductase [Deltaproteobacteria bacterium]
MDYSKLFESGSIGSLELKNRLVLAASGTGFAGIYGEVTDRLIDYYAERAKGGVGLITVECTIVTPERQFGITVPTELRIYNHRYIPGLNLIVEAIHRHGAKAAIQLNSPGGLIDPSIEPGVTPATASPIEAQGIVASYRTRECTLEDIKILQAAYADAAERAKMAGFDAVELHCAHGYLLCTFQSAHTNKRNDAYGGSFDNRMRMAVETIRQMRRKIGPDFPIITRIPCEEYVPEGIDIEESIKMAKVYIEAGGNAINITSGTLGAPISKCYGGSWPQYAKRALLKPHAARMKEAVDVPVMIVGGYDRADLANDIIKEGKADFIEISRGLIADPQLPNKLKGGRQREIRPCIRCNSLCLGRVLQYRSISCAVNPVVGYEGRYRLKESPTPKKVVVVGAGPGGLEAAMVATMRGHKVTLFEQDKQVGGALIAASVPQFKEEEKRLIEYFRHQIDKLGVRVKLGHQADSDSILHESPDVVIIATGAQSAKPDIPGSEKGVDAVDLLMGRASVPDPAVIIGGGLVGCETALHLALQGRKVSIIEMMDEILVQVNVISRYGLIESLTEQGVPWSCGIQLASVQDSEIGVIDKAGKHYSIEGHAVYALGLTSKNAGLMESLTGKIPELYNIGDCISPRKIWNAIHEGFRIANDI